MEARPASEDCIKSEEVTSPFLDPVHRELPNPDTITLPLQRWLPLTSCEVSKLSLSVPQFPHL